MERYFTIEKLMPCCSEASRCKYCRAATAEAHRHQTRIIANLESLISHLLEPLHEAYKNDINVLDGYRCSRLNRKRGIPWGPCGNQHIHGHAVTLTTGNTTDNLWLAYLVQQLDDWDVLLLEDADASVGSPDYLYVSYRRTGKNRREIWCRVKDSDTYHEVKSLKLRET